MVVGISVEDGDTCWIWDVAVSVVVEDMVVVLVVMAVLVVVVVLLLVVVVVTLELCSVVLVE